MKQYELRRYCRVVISEKSYAKCAQVDDIFELPHALPTNGHWIISLIWCFWQLYHTGPICRPIHKVATLNTQRNNAHGSVPPHWISQTLCADRWPVLLACAVDNRTTSRASYCSIEDTYTITTRNLNRPQAEIRICVRVRSSLVMSSV